MTYHRGTLAQFNSWHDAAKLAEGITPEGKIGYVDGQPAPENQRTTSYSIAVRHPGGANDYIWPFGARAGALTKLTPVEAKAAGFFPEE